MAIFTGAGVAIVTPFNHADESINYDKLEELIERQIENHTDALFICCTTGEAATMTEEEHTGMRTHRSAGMRRAQGSFLA